jgi:hypothetical protein
VSLPRPAIVATVRDAADVLGSFVAYHVAIGFARIYLFFDDPADPCAAALDGHPRVTVVRCDDQLRELWRALRLYPRFGDHVATEVMARQLLNCELAIDMAAADGLDWLLHIDSDEAFLCEGGSVPEHFRALDLRGVRNVVYTNCEALPETLEVGDYFREVTLFRVNINRRGALRFDARQMALLRAAHFTDEHFTFHLCNNGKAAARVAPELVPVTMHEFGRILPDGGLDRGHETRRFRPSTVRSVRSATGGSA